MSPEPQALKEQNELQALQRAVTDPTRATMADVQALQRTVGNRAVQRLLDAQRGGAAQRQEDEEEEEEELLQARPAGDVLRQGGSEGFQIDDETAGRINSARGAGHPLDGAVQAQMSETMGYDFSGVRVHTDAESDDLNQQLQARAFTTGRDIFFRSGEYEPGSDGGRELLAHELSHVAQQSTGRVGGEGSRMTVRSSSDALEQEAEATAKRAIKLSNKTALQRAMPVLPIDTLPDNPAQQRMDGDGAEQGLPAVRLDAAHLSAIGGSSLVQRELTEHKSGEKEVQVPAPGIQKADGYYTVQDQTSGGHLWSNGFANCIGVAATNGQNALVAHFVAASAEKAGSALKKIMGEGWKGIVGYGSSIPASVADPKEYLERAKKGAETVARDLNLTNTRGDLGTIGVNKGTVYRK